MMNAVRGGPKLVEEWCHTWWVTFENGKAACYEGTLEEVTARAATDGDVRTIKSLPYPADPRTEPKAQYGANGACPSFCYTPAQCQGRTSCPKPYACSE